MASLVTKRHRRAWNTEYVRRSLRMPLALLSCSPTSPTVGQTKTSSRVPRRRKKKRGKKVPVPDFGDELQPIFFFFLLTDEHRRRTK